MGDSFPSGPSHPDIHSRRRCAVAAAACVDRSRIATGTPRTLCFPLPPTLDTIRNPATHPTLHSTVLVFPLVERNTGIPGVARVGTTGSVWEKTGGWSPSCLQFRTSSVQFSDPLLRFSLGLKTLYGVRLHKEAKFQKDGALNSYLWRAPEWTSWRECFSGRQKCASNLLPLQRAMLIISPRLRRNFRKGRLEKSLYCCWRKSRGECGCCNPVRFFYEVAHASAPLILPRVLR